MPTTSLKLPEDLKSKAADLAKSQHMSPHAYMVEAIRRATEQDELHQQFVDDSMSARQQALDSGKAYPAASVHEYILKKANGDKATRPKARSWRK